MSFYESDRALNEYLLFHFGTEREVLPYDFGPRDALGFPQRCVTRGIDFPSLPNRKRALDLGCAVGGASFALAREFESVVGIDLSQRFIDAARMLVMNGSLDYSAVVEGELQVPRRAIIPKDVIRNRVSFEVGSALDLRADLGAFSVVLAANLIDRLPSPARFLLDVHRLVERGGQLVLTSPYTWLEEYTPKGEWLGEGMNGESGGRTSEAIRRLLGEKFELIKSQPLPFLIREHERKFQWSVAEATTWRRR